MEVEVKSCLMIPDTRRSQWLTEEVIEGWKVGEDIFVFALCIVRGQLDLDESYDGSMERIHALQYSTPNRRFPKDECINPWMVIRLSDDRLIDSFATLREAFSWAKGAVLWRKSNPDRLH